MKVTMDTRLMELSKIYRDSVDDIIMATASLAEAGNGRTGQFRARMERVMLTAVWRMLSVEQFAQGKPNRRYYLTDFVSDALGSHRYGYFHWSKAGIRTCVIHMTTSANKTPEKQVAAVKERIDGQMKAMGCPYIPVYGKPVFHRRICEWTMRISI